MSDERISEEGSRISGRNAQRNNILAARVIAETVKTTLGPKGMDKMLVDGIGNITVTNDGVTILEEMAVDHPAAKMIVDIARTQEAEVGDGTTTAVMLAGKLLENAEKLLDQGIHPTILARGYRWAEEKAQEILNDLFVEVNSEEELMRIARTAMTGKGVEYLKEKLGKIVIEAAGIVAENGKMNMEDVRIEMQRGKSFESTELIRGIVLDGERQSSQMPERIESARIALIEESLGIENLESNAEISISTPDQFQNFFSHEESVLKSKIMEIKNSGANVIFVRKRIDDLVKSYLGKEGIYAVSRISERDMRNLAKTTGAKIVSRLKELNRNDLGNASYVEEKKEGGRAMTYVMGCRNPKAITILIRGGTDPGIQEMERSISDALRGVALVLSDSKVVAGGGAVEMELSKRLKEFAKTIKGRECLAIEEFASALEFIPRTLAENAGMDPLDVLTELRASHDANNKNAGLNLFNERVEDTLRAGIIEPLEVKVQAISSASEVAIMILRIDDVIAAKRLNGRSSSDIGRMVDYDD